MKMDGGDEPGCENEGNAEERDGAIDACTSTQVEAESHSEQLLSDTMRDSALLLVPDYQRETQSLSLPVGDGE